jgi:hypothetical protein
MPRWSHISPFWPILRGFYRGGAANYAILIGIAVFCAVQAILVGGGSYIDGTWYSANGGTGFLEHYGVWALLVSDPLLLISAAYAYRRFRLAMTRLPIVEGKESKLMVSRIVRPYADHLRLKRRGIYLYVLFVAIGIIGWVDNLYRTNYPYTYFDHDVFDSTNFQYGYYATKFALFNSWVLIYPAVGFILISMSLSTRMILIKLTERELIQPRVLHPDGSFGLSELGRLNVILLFPYLLSFVTLFAVMFTHRQAYYSALIPLLILSFIFISISYLTIGPVLVQVQEARKAAFKRLAVESTAFERMDGDKKIVFAVQRLSFAMSNRSPYSLTTQIALQIMRLVPIAMTASRLFVH